MKKDLLIFCFVNTSTAISSSLIAALYTELAYDIGFSESFVGLLFSVYSLTNLLIIPFTNNLIHSIGRFNLLVITNLIKVSI